jgi:hypothetical protein
MLLAKAALERGDFKTALARANDAKLTYALERLGKFNAIAFILNNWLNIIITLILVSFLTYISLLSLKYQLVTKRLKTLAKEEHVLLGLIKEIQRECFEQGKLTMAEYNTSLLQYEKRMSKVIQETIKLETLKVNLVKIFKREHSRLSEEKDKLINIIKTTQREYLETGKIETREYQNRMGTYAERLVEIEERLADIETKRAIKGKKPIQIKKQSRSNELFQLFIESFKLDPKLLKNLKYTSFVLIIAATISLAAYLTIKSGILTSDKVNVVKEALSPVTNQSSIIIYLIAIVVITILAKKDYTQHKEISSLKEEIKKLKK